MCLETICQSRNLIQIHSKLAYIGIFVCICAGRENTTKLNYISLNLKCKTLRVFSSVSLSFLEKLHSQVGNDLMLKCSKRVHFEYNI